MTRLAERVTARPNVKKLGRRDWRPPRDPVPCRLLPRPPRDVGMRGSVLIPKSVWPSV